MVKRVKVIGISFAAAILVAFGAVAGYYVVGNRALPNTYIGATEVSGMKESEIRSDIAKALREGEIHISGTGITTTTANLNQMGFSASAADIANEAVTLNRNPLSYVKAIVKGNVVTPKLNENEPKAAQFAASLTAENPDVIPPVEPALEFNETEFVVKAGKDGEGVDKAALRTAAEKLLSTQESLKHEAKITKLHPTLTEKYLSVVAKQANDLISPEISITTEADPVSASLAEKAQWVKYDRTKATLDTQAVLKWVNEKAALLENGSKNGFRYVTEDGTIVKVERDPVIGKTVSNQSDVAASIVSSLSKGRAANASFTMTDAEPKWDEKVVAEGVENLAYMAGIGERWIDINLGSNRVYAYEGATLIYNFPMIDGAPATPSDVGNFKVYAKLVSQTMRGRNPDGSEYETPNVPWIMYYNGGEATHGSSAWRSSWGYDAGYGGSHGCINMSNSDAKTLWDWASVGTPVITHY